MTADETPAQGDEPTTAVAADDDPRDAAPGAEPGRVQSPAADPDHGDLAGAVPVTAIGPAIRDVATRLERIEVALTGWLAPPGGGDDEPLAASPPGVRRMLARLDEQAAAAERHDEAFAAALRDLVGQLNEFAGTVTAAGPGGPAQPARIDTDSMAAMVEAATTRALGTVRHQLDQLAADVAAARTAAPHAEVLERLDRLSAVLHALGTAPPPTVLERLDRLTAAVNDVGATPAAVTDDLDRLNDGLAALLSQGATPPPDLGPRLDVIAGTLTALLERTADRPPPVDGHALLAAVADLAARLGTLDELPANVERTRVDLSHRLDAVAGLPDAVAAVESAAERTGAAVGSLDALAELLAAVRDGVVPLGTTLPAALARLEVELSVVGDRTAEATVVARGAEAAAADLRTGVETTLAAVRRLAPPDGGGGAGGAALARLEARASEQARLLAAVQGAVADLARSAPADVDAFERTVVADLDAVGEQLDAVGRVLQQLVGTVAVVEAGTIGVTPRAERSHTAAQAALADLRAARRR